MEEICSNDLDLNKRFLDFNKILHQNFHHKKHTHRTQSKGSSMNKVNFPFPVLLTIQLYFNYYISQVSHIKFHVFFFHRLNLVYYNLLITFYNISISNI